MTLTGASALPLQREKTDRKKKMPAKDVMDLFRRQKLHSGPDGPVVKDKSQATAIQLSMARKEGADIPPPPEKKGKSFGSRIGRK